MTRVWVTTGRTESGDDVGPYVWAREPSDEAVITAIDAQFGDEEAEMFREGCGILHTEQTEVID
ncbi:hypothetical protein [Mesorhizobium sp. M0244]|uniref:hypothetical protein n=1 Tax=Mesorhizobium sp. M0244 TaxID=2956926 RepID=UPI00333D667B